MVHPSIHSIIHREYPPQDLRNRPAFLEGLRKALRSLENSALELFLATAETLRWSGSNLRLQPVPLRTHRRDR
ncbi:MAG: hypothetical protein AB7W37_09695 [Syntrophobacteraceae bacterium]